MADIDGWHARDLIAPLFFNNNTDLHNLIRKHRILPYLTGSLHPSFYSRICRRTSDGSTETGWRHSPHPLRSDKAPYRCFASLAVNATPVRNEAAELFTSTYDNFIQAAGIRDGASHSAKILSVFYDNLDASDPNDPEVIIKIDISNAFNWDGQVHLAKGKTGEQQGDPLEMLIFNLTIHHLWGRVLAKFQRPGQSHMRMMVTLRPS
jgi:hypothetical protein